MRHDLSLTPPARIDAGRRSAAPDCARDLWPPPPPRPGPPRRRLPRAPPRPRPGELARARVAATPRSLERRRAAAGTPAERWPWWRGAAWIDGSAATSSPCVTWRRFGAEACTTKGPGRPPWPAALARDNPPHSLHSLDNASQGTTFAMGGDLNAGRAGAPWNFLLREPWVRSASILPHFMIIFSRQVCLLMFHKFRSGFTLTHFGDEVNVALFLHCSEPARACPGCTKARSARASLPTVPADGALPTTAAWAALAAPFRRPDSDLV